MASQIASMEVFGLLICLFSLRQILLPSIRFVPKFSHFFASRKDTERIQLFNDGEAITQICLFYFEFPNTSIVTKSLQKKRKKLFQSITGYDRYFVGGLM